MKLNGNFYVFIHRFWHRARKRVCPWFMLFCVSGGLVWCVFPIPPFCVSLLFVGRWCLFFLQSSDLVVLQPPALLTLQLLASSRRNFETIDLRNSRITQISICLNNQHKSVERSVKYENNFKENLSYLILICSKYECRAHVCNTCNI